MSAFGGSSTGRVGESKLYIWILKASIASHFEGDSDTFIVKESPVFNKLEDCVSHYISYRQKGESYDVPDCYGKVTLAFCKLSDL